MDNRGVSLIELIVIIFIVGVLMPVIIMPFVTASKGVKNPVNFSRLKYVARQNLDTQISCVDNTLACPAPVCLFQCGWPTSVSLPGGAGTQTVVETVDGDAYTTVITWQFTDFAFAPTNGAPPTNNQYLLITVTTTDAQNNSVTLESVKARDLVL